MAEDTQVKKTFYITTAIDYPSSKPHLGHAYEKIIADTIARWHRLCGEHVFFLTGTDEHGLKIKRAAEKEGMTPQEFVDMQARHFQRLCEVLNISNDRFIRTTEEQHVKACQHVFQTLYNKGYIYLGRYEGLYCADCETFYQERELLEGRLCPVHKRPCEFVSEESYFFRMSRFEEKIKEYLKKDGSVLPSSKAKEVLNRMKSGLRDLSVSRTSFDWGVPVPFNNKHVQYVWMDALLNYLTGIGYPNKDYEEYWPCDIHLIGKDIVWHHTAIWYSILLGLDIALPKTVLVHGFIKTESGEKMSKSRGTVIDPVELAEKYGADTLRYTLLSQIPFGEDGMFSEKLLIECNNNELANELGNLLNRTLKLIERKCGGKVPEGKVAEELKRELRLERFKHYMERFEFHHALAELMRFVKACNSFINSREPWKQEGRALNDTLYTLADALRIISILISPFMPETAQKMSDALGIKSPWSLKECKFGRFQAGAKVKSTILFKKIELTK
jgi:methionyl-tRNA synthetase